MNESYLLHNETAKGLYFDYAKDLPIIALCSREKPDNKIYSNITEAFLFNDFYKLDAMRHCGIEEKYITGNASDYEKFKAFCSVLPKFAGHPLYLLSHIELIRHFDCHLEINENNRDRIWNEVNTKILSDSISEELLIGKFNIEHHYSLIISWMDELYRNEMITDLASLETTLIGYVNEANGKGCRIALYNAFTDFIKPNPYAANEIVKRIKSKDLSVELEDCNLLDMQIARTLGKTYKNLGWTWLLTGKYIDEDAIEYLLNSDALPKIKNHIEFELGESEEYLELQLRGYAMKYPLGQLICTVNAADNCLCYAQNDYFRRILCNIIGKWVENGEYTSDEKTLKNLIEDILYNNLKKAIS